MPQKNIFQDKRICVLIFSFQPAGRVGRKNRALHPRVSRRDWITMAKVRDYFEVDFSHTVRMETHVKLLASDGGEIAVICRIHLDFSSKALFASFYLDQLYSLDELVKLIDQIDGLWKSGWPAPSNIVLPATKLYAAGELKIGTNPFQVISRFPGGPETRHDELHFSGRIYLYLDTDLTPEQQAKIKSSIKNKMLDPHFRGTTYAKKREQFQKPIAFISHDSRDKSSIARPIALGLQSNLVPVWYDEFSLPVGAKLRESIERGIKESKKCVLVVTKNFIKNEGWTKAEFDSVFTKEIFEKGNALLPVWHEVTAREVYEYSPWLANIKAVDWSEGAEKVVRKLQREIEGEIA